jgi:hypothetical protein
MGADPDVIEARASSTAIGRPALPSASPLAKRSHGESYGVIVIVYGLVRKAGRSPVPSRGVE